MFASRVEVLLYRQLTEQLGQSFVHALHPYVIESTVPSLHDCDSPLVSHWYESILCNSSKF